MNNPLKNRVDINRILNTEEGAYMLGFIQTDGNIRKKYISIEISKKDEDILVKMMGFIGHGSITYRTRDTNFKKKYSSCCYRIHSKEFIDMLNSFGTPCGKKSETLKPILEIKEEFLRHYIRGIYDGDGSLGFSKLGYPYISLTTKSEIMASFIKNIFIEKFNILCETKKNKRDNCYNILLTREGAQEFSKWIYQDNKISLNRKNSLYLEILNWSREKYKHKRRLIANKKWSNEEIEIVKNNDYNYNFIFNQNLIKNRSWETIKLKCLYLCNLDNGMCCKNYLKQKNLSL